MPSFVNSTSNARPCSDLSPQYLKSMHQAYTHGAHEFISTYNANSTQYILEEKYRSLTYHAIYYILPPKGLTIILMYCYLQVQQVLITIIDTFCKKKLNLG